MMHDVPEPPRSVLARTAAGAGWIIGWRLATRLLGLCNTLILVRLLVPADFGLVALGTSFVIAVDALSTLGVEDALVRERAPSRAIYDTAFTMNALRGAATGAVVAALAWPIALFFKEPRLSSILFALAVGALIEGVECIGVVDFRRDMTFHKEFQLQVLPRLLSIAVTVAGAFAWRSYWALVAGIVTSRLARTGFSYRMHPYRPRLTLSAWRHLIGFSVWTWAISMAELCRDRMDAFVIGRVLNPASVGVYAIGEEVATLPTSELVRPLGRASFSGFTAARHAGQTMAETYTRAVSTTFLLTLPAGLGIALVARPLVQVAVGGKWIAAVPVIQVMGLIGAFSVFGNIAIVLVSAHALLRRQFAVTVICMLLRLLLLVPLVDRFGILGAAIGALLGTTLEHASFVVLAFRRFDLGYRRLWRQVWRTLAAGGAMAAVVIGFTARGPDLPAAASLIALVALGASVYVAVLTALWLLSGGPEGAEADLLTVARRIVKKR